MSHNRPSPLQFDRRKKKWVEQPKSWVQELSDRSDDFWGGLILGVGVGGFIPILMMLLAAVIELL